MKKFSTILLMFVAAVALAAPVSTFTATAPTNYVDGTVIPATDVLSYAIYCGNTSGGPYNLVEANIASLSSTPVDVQSCVTGPGTYYFVATATSSAFGTESAFSGEVSRTYSASDLGKVPFAPVLISVQ
jgi:hypothetical protein